MPLSQSSAPACGEPALSIFQVLLKCHSSTEVILTQHQVECIVTFTVVCVWHAHAHTHIYGGTHSRSHMHARGRQQISWSAALGLPHRAWSFHFA